MQDLPRLPEEPVNLLRALRGRIGPDGSRVFRLEMRNRPDPPRWESRGDLWGGRRLTARSPGADTLPDVVDQVG